MSLSPDLPPRRTVTLQLPALVTGTLKAMAAALVVVALYFGKDILVPLALAGLLAFLLDPLVSLLKRWHLPRHVGVAVVTIATLAAVAGASTLIGLQVIQLGKNLPQYQSTIETKLRSLRVGLIRDASLSSAGRLIGAVGNEVDATRKALDNATGNHAKPPLRVQVAGAEQSPLQLASSWLSPVLAPLLTGGIAFVLLVFILLGRHDLRDRVLRLAGGDLHHMTDALNEAANRVSRYLTMQVLVNLSYGVPLALGLWAIGVPGAVLWGALAAVLRFVPYVGPVVASLFPLALAFAVDPGWQMLMWTLLLVLSLELVINNVIEPWLYGASTGLAAVAVLLSAAFWTVLWGPVGLILATPLTVCLVVMGRHLPQFRFLDLLLGSDPVFDQPTQLYQRLLAGNVEEATELAEQQIATEGLATFYSRTAVPALGMAAADHARVASAEHRHRVSSGVVALLRELREEHPVPAGSDEAAGPSGRVLCIGLRWQADSLAADMLAHTLAIGGVAAQALPATAVSAERIGSLDLRGVQVVCLSSFHPEPEALARYACRRLLRLQPDLKIVLTLWHAPASLREPEAASLLGASAIALSLLEATHRITDLLPERDAQGRGDADDDGGDPHRDPATVDPAVLRVCRALDGPRQALGMQAAQRAAEVFDTDRAVIWWADGRTQSWQLDSAGAADAALDPAFGDTHLNALLRTPRALVVPDLARDPRVRRRTGEAAGAGAAAAPARFLAAAPLCLANGTAVGALCLLDARPRMLNARELRLLEALARDLMQQLHADELGAEPGPAEPSAQTGWRLSGWPRGLPGLPGLPASKDVPPEVDDAAGAKA
jgi:predicted PurR-regulated permease PerM